MPHDTSTNYGVAEGGATVTLDGRNAKVSSSEGRSYAAMLYESLFCINVGGVEENADVSSSQVPLTSIRIFDRNHSSTVYDFYKRNDDSSLDYRLFALGSSLFLDGL